MSNAVLDIVYPLERRSWEVPSVPSVNPYIGAIESARMGVYDFNTGGDDFLALSLPSLVLLTAPAQNNFYEEAQESLKQALLLNEKTVLAPYLLGTLLLRRQQKSAALEQFRRAWETDSSCYPAGVQLARLLLENKHNDEAFLITEKLLSEYPQNTEMLQLGTEGALATGHWDIADTYITQVLQRDPGNSAFLLYRIAILMERGEYLQASSLLNVYSRSERTSKQYLLIRTRLQKEWNKNLTAATATIQEALSLYPDDPEVLLAAAEIAYQTGQNIQSQSSTDMVLKVLNSDPENREALILLAENAIRGKDWQTAGETTTRLLALSQELSQDRQSLLLYIEACIGTGNTGEAVTRSAALYREFPGDEQIITVYIRALIAARDTTTALNSINTHLSTASSSMKSALFYERSKIVSGDEAKLADLRSSLNANPRNEDALFALYRFYYDSKDYRKAQYYLRQVVALNPADTALLQLQHEIDSLLSR